MMTEAVQVALIVAIPTTITSIGALIVAVRNSGRIKDIKVATDGMKDALVKVTGESEHAKGKIEGAREEKEKNGNGSS